MNIIFRMMTTMVFTCLLTGCGPRYVDFFPCYDDGTPKPVVALVPLIDNSGCTIPWDLSHELTEGVRNQLMCNGDLYLPPESEVTRIVEKNAQVDFFGKNIQFANNFKRYEFVAFVEILQHELVPCEPETDKVVKGLAFNYTLVQRVRLRVIDVRDTVPCVIFQEIIRGEYKVPAGLDNIDYCDRCWGSNKYALTPMCKAHEKLIENISSRLESATWSVR